MHERETVGGNGFGKDFVAGEGNAIRAERHCQPHIVECRRLADHAVGFAEGQELTEHTSTRHALIQILSGECEFSLAGRPHTLKAGDFLYMPPNLPHAVKATKQFSMLLTLIKP